jgi:hypothetical protein
MRFIECHLFQPTISGPQLMNESTDRGAFQTHLSAGRVTATSIILPV